MTDFARTVVDAFVERRQKGSAVSAADEQLVFMWEQSGAPAWVVLEGIDDAFARKAAPPESLQACGRWIKAAIARWHAGGEGSIGRGGGGTQEGSPEQGKEEGVRSVGEGTQEGSPEQGRGALPAWLVGLAAARGGALAAAVDEVVAELAAAEETFAPNVVLAAVVDALLDRLGVDEAAAVQAAAAAGVRREDAERRTAAWARAVVEAWAER